MNVDPDFLVLVVDDNPDTRSNLCDILELDHYRIETAGTAAEVLGRNDWSRISAVLLDRRLPDSNAEEVLPRLRQLAPDTAILIVTGYADLQGAIAALRREASNVRQALEDRKIIERAKGVLMKELSLSEPEAFRRLQKTASTKNLKLVEVAQLALTTAKALQKS
jgi:AmiR/NasT family two-component response regulator